MKLHQIAVAALLANAPQLLLAQSTQKSATQTTIHSAPDFTRPTLDGKPLRLTSYRGKLVLLNFWATWCGPCIAEIPRFSAWQTKFGPQGFQVVGVSMDDDQAPVQKFNRKYQPTYPIVMGDEHLGDLYGGVLGLPVSYLISPEGKVIARYQGETDLNQLEARINTLLPSKNR
jgi:thiol-disulfide isomerase/thioredoxin